MLFHMLKKSSAPNSPASDEREYDSYCLFLFENVTEIFIQQWKNELRFLVDQGVWNESHED